MLLLESSLEEEDVFFPNFAKHHTTTEQYGKLVGNTQCQGIIESGRVSYVETKITDVTIRTIGIFANNDIGVVDLPNYSHRREQSHDDLVG